MIDVFEKQPYYRGDLYETEAIETTKGTDIMLGMLMQQYQAKPNLLAHFSVLFEEMDELFFQLDTVYRGRFILEAIGEQLDKIGRILDQSRTINLPGIWFGFQPDGGPIPPDTGPFSDEVTPSNGGQFRDESLEGYTTFPLSDAVYRRVLLAKAITHNRHTVDVNQYYKIISTLLGKTPRKMELTVTAPRSLLLDISVDDTTVTDQSLISYFSDYCVPLGTILAITRT